ncbi:YHS domain protein [Rubripirellula lacrimiformis]|uniref:YHS domain protein n=1 Tax=Rubripirellula lacrimiformis TaxID=1930273 RepID=A0A517NCY7_9BACT|nr:hypothetical protein [Rubripirellula lacrimiformis]QDT04966.1 YHS domain protein [Rubripirellula lacrimiformis]
MKRRMIFSACLIAILGSTALAQAAEVQTAEVQHTGTQHTGTQHTGTQHTGTQHTGTQHTGTQHTGTQHTGTQHTGTQHNHVGHDHAAAGTEMNDTSSTARTSHAGPHGGSLKQVGNLQFETVVAQGGLRLFVFDRGGTPVQLDQGRGTVSVKIEGNPKRYRYDLLPDEKGGLSAAVNLSKLAGIQMDVAIQVVGVAPQTVRFAEVATVPISRQQLAADAIARQKICPVSGKALGSMGEPVLVGVDGQSLFVCCDGCVDAVHANPAKYAGGRPQITVTTATLADAAGIAAQKVCPVMDEPLGGMGTPVKVLIGDKPVYLCCKGCVKKVQAEPAKYLAMVADRRSEGQSGTPPGTVPAGKDQIREGVFRVTAADAPFVSAQKVCPVMDEPLDAMDGPYKVNAAGKAIYICCPGCAKKIAADPARYLAVLKSHGVEAPAIR